MRYLRDTAADLQGLSAGRSQMPPIREIDCNDGLYIKMTSGAVFHETAAQMKARLDSFPGNLKKKEAAYNTWLQSQEPFQKVYPVAEYDPDHLVNLDPDNLPPWRIIAGAYVGEIIMWVAVHFYDDDPLSFVAKCQDKEIGPITGEWWL
jgi:hypothetical protein